MAWPGLAPDRGTHDHHHHLSGCCWHALQVKGISLLLFSHSQSTTFLYFVDNFYWHGRVQSYDPIPYTTRLLVECRSHSSSLSLPLSLSILLLSLLLLLLLLLPSWSLPSSSSTQWQCNCTRCLSLTSHSKRDPLDHAATTRQVLLFSSLLYLL